MTKYWTPDGWGRADDPAGLVNPWPGPHEPAPAHVAALATFQAAKAALLDVKRIDGKNRANAIIDHCVFELTDLRTPFPDESPTVTQFRQALLALYLEAGAQEGDRLLEYLWVECDCYRRVSNTTERKTVH